MFTSLEDIVEKSKREKKPVSELMIEQEIELNGVSRSAVEKLMKRNLTVMMQAVEEGLAGVSSKTGLTGGDAKKLKEYIDSGNSITGADFLTGVAAAIATNEVNASLGLICATPTAGSAGVLPGCVHALKQKFDIDEIFGEKKVSVNYSSSILEGVNLAVVEALDELDKETLNKFDKLEYINEIKFANRL